MAYEFNLSDTFLSECLSGEQKHLHLSGRESIIEAQSADPELRPLFARALEDESLKRSPSVLLFRMVCWSESGVVHCKSRT